MTDFVIRREERTYEPYKQVSWFVDRALAELRNDAGAHDRLTRHMHEVDVEQRANPSTTATRGGEFAPPLWLTNLASPAAAGGRVLADLIDYNGNRFLLPSGVSSINLPRIVAGAVDGVQPGQNGAAPSADPTTALATGSGQIVTIAGHVDISQQLLDQSPAPGVDKTILLELGSNYNQNLEVQMLTGTGTNGQLLGLSSVSGRNSISGSGGSTIATLWPLIGQMMAAVGNTRLQPVSHLIMAPRRWAWIASSVDSSNRPISSPGANGPTLPDYPQMGGTSDDQRFRSVGPINSAPVWLSGAILTQGSAVNTAADVIYGVRPRDMFLWESAPNVIIAPNPLSGTMQVRISLHQYVAFTPDRYPAGIGVLTAIPAPTNF
jgi:hypothetical protein